MLASSSQILRHSWHNLCPNVKLGLMTNGLRKLDMDTLEKISWVRVSINAADSKSYKKIHGRDKFYDALESISYYLSSKVEMVNIGFVFTPLIYIDIVKFSVMFFEFLVRKQIDWKKGLTIQFRPVADASYSRFKLSKEQIHDLDSQLLRVSENVHQFILTNTNYNEVVKNQCIPLTTQFSRCSFSVLQLNIDAKGDVYPCPQKAHTYVSKISNLFDKNFVKELPAKLRDSYELHSISSCPSCCHCSINAAFERLDLTQNYLDNIGQFF